MIQEKTYQLKFEKDILRVACALGVLRMIIALYRDLTTAYERVDFIIDLSLLTIVLLPLILTFSSVKMKHYVVPFCFLIAAAMPFSWISSGGLESNNEYQIIGAIFLYGMILSGRWLIFFSGLMVVMEVVLIFVWRNHMELIVGLRKEPSMESIHFILMALVTTTGVLYLKDKLCKKRDQLNDQREILAIKLSEVSDQTSKIREQKSELERINRDLEKKVMLRSEELNRQNESLSHFINLSLKDINAPLYSIIESIEEMTDMSKDNDMVQLLADSGIELEKSVMSVANRLEEDVTKFNLNQEE